MSKKNIAIFLSGKGTLARSIIRYGQNFAKHYDVKFLTIFGEEAIYEYNKEGVEVGIHGDPINYNFNAFHMKVDNYERGTMRDHHEKSISNLMEANKIDLVVLAGFTKILSEEFVNRWKVINIHPSLLPKYAGMFGDDIYKKAIENKDSHVGITVHWVDGGIDTGKHITRQRTRIFDDDDEKSLKKKVQSRERNYYPEVIDDVCASLQND